MDQKVIDNIFVSERYLVAGRGFVGLSIAYFLKKLAPQSEVLLYDPNPLCTSASGAASGLLEPITGRMATSTARAAEGMEATRALLDVVSDHLGGKVYIGGGVLHPPMNLVQRNIYKNKVLQHPEQFAFDEEGVFVVKEGINVFSRLYLEGLFSLVQSMGVQFIPKKVPFDEPAKRIFLGIGAGIEEFFPGQFSLTRGQAMEVKRGATHFTLPKVHKGYIALDADPDIYHVGSTYERENLDKEPDSNKAIEELKRRNEEIYPEVHNVEILAVRSGVRVYAGQIKLPQIIQKGPNVVALTGFGSKGLLYHALYAQELVEKHL
ncbi:MAG: NAD(P)/FAD-dependent oxidoreductase [Chlamydiia bacterium]